MSSSADLTSGAGGGGDPYEGLSNPTKQARRLMDERGIRRRGGDGDDSDADDALGGGGGAGYTEEQEKRIESLENELADTKRLLMDVLYDKQQLERDKAELQRLVEELSGGEGATREGGSSKHDPVQDRAKATILALRLKRVEQKRSQFVDFVKTTGRTAGSAARRLKTTTTELKVEVQEQFERMQEQLTDSVSDFETMVDAINRRSAVLGSGGGGGGVGGGGMGFNTSSEGAVGDEALGSGGGAGADAYVGMVAAAVQQQQRSTILSADHPLVVRLAVLYNTVDSVVDGANAAWREMRCFAEGTAPQLQRPRRYIDVMSNVNNYIAQAERLRRGVEYTQGAQRLHGDLRLPGAMRQSASLVAQSHASLAARIAEFFDAMRTVRTSVVVKASNLTTAFRIFAACDAVQQDSSRIYTTYLRLSKVHVGAMLRHMSHLLKFGRNKLTDFELVDTTTNSLEVGACPCCAAPVACEDCYRVLGCKHPVLRLAYERHRKAVGDFTLARLEHFRKLRGLIDESIRILTVARLVPLEKESGTAAANEAVDAMIRKPQPPTSVNYFTRQRKSEQNRIAVAHGGMPDSSAAGLGVRPPTLEEKRSHLLRMVAETDLRHLPGHEFPPDELARAVGYEVLPYDGAAGRWHGDSVGFDDTTGGVCRRSARALPAVRLPGATAPRGATATTAGRHSSGWGHGSGAHTARAGTCGGPSVRLDAFTSERSGRLVEAHLPDLAGPREAEASGRHADRLDAARRHNAKITSTGGRQQRSGGGGPGSSRSKADGRLGFNTSASPRTLTERMLGPDA